MPKRSKTSSSVDTASPQLRRLRALSLWAETFPLYQRRWVAETRNALALKARQIGFSFASAGKRVKRGLFERRTQLIVSAREELASEVLGHARNHCLVLADLGLPEAADFIVDNGEEIAWRTGGRILALPANPNTARGYSGDVFLDEYAYVEQAQGIKDALFPIVSRAGLSIDVASTPNGAQGPFWELATSPPASWAFFCVTIDDAERDGFPVDRAKLLELCGGDERLFAQWYLCQFLDADLQYIPTALVERAKWKGPLPKLERASIYAGLDVGREHDLTALTVIAELNGLFWLLGVHTCKRTDFRRQRAMIEGYRETYGWDRLCVDATGLGMQLAEELKEEFGEDEVEPLPFTNPVKEDLATRLLLRLREKRVRMTETDETRKLAAELVAMRRVVRPSGAIGYEVPRTTHGHGDRLWSLALALRAADGGAIVRGVGGSPLLAVA